MGVVGTTGKWQDISRKLPLLTTALLAVTVAVIAGMAYRETERSLVATARERVMSTSRQIAGMFSTANDRLLRDGAPFARDTTLTHALADPSARLLQAARRRLAALRGQAVSIEIWNTRGERVLFDGTPAGPPATFEAVRAGAARMPIGPLLAVDDTVMTVARLPMIRAGRDTVGYVRVEQRVSPGQASQLLVALIGDQAQLLVGNASGDVWTDLSRRADGPPIGDTTRTVVGARDSTGTEWIGSRSVVTGTPWVVWVALPQSVVSGQMHAVLFRMLIVSLVVLALGALAASVLSRHIIAPLAEVRAAAEQIAQGDYAARVHVAREDEVGRVARAFNDMAGAIQSATVDLQVQQVELETQQMELEEANEELRHNINEATSAREAAEHSQARAAAIVAGAIDAVIVAGQDGSIVEFNSAAERAFGYAASQAIGRRIGTLIPALGAAESGQGGTLAAYVEKRGLQPHRMRDELTAVRADGREISIELAVTQISVAGPPMFACFLRDLSERKQLEAQLQQSQKMEAVGRLAGGVAHDFNNMLTVIISYVDLVLADPDITDAVRTDLRQVRSAADRASTLTRQLLAFSRKQVLHPAVLDLNAVVEDVSKMLSRVVPENIRIETKLERSVVPIHADRGQLEQVLMNLAVNARDAMPSGGSLVIETSTAVLDEEYVALHAGGTPGPHAVLSVRDTGIGMDAATRERIFEPFFTTKALGQGTGLGLATVYGIVRQSGGGIYVYSEPGRGTTFKIYLPAHLGEATDGAEAAAPALNTSGPATILLVEDDEAVREATRLVLTRLGHSVVPATDVASALQIIRAGDPRLHVVLTDAVMPGQSGLDLAEILNEERPDLPVIIMSGYTEEAVSGGRAMPRSVLFVEKPFTGSVISQALADVRATAAAG